MSKFKKDEEYGYTVNFERGRHLPEGHKNIFNFRNSDTEVDVIKKIIDEYIDTSDVKSVAEFNNHKIDFATNVIDSIIIILNEKLNQVQSLNDETDNSLADVSHRMIKPMLNGTTMNIEDKVNLFDIQSDLLLSRRYIKDAISALRVMIENTEKCRNFILCMNNRKYTPKAERFKDNDDYKIDSPSSHNVSSKSLVNTPRENGNGVTGVSNVLLNNKKKYGN